MIGEAAEGWGAGAGDDAAEWVAMPTSYPNKSLWEIILTKITPARA